MGDSCKNRQKLWLDKHAGCGISQKLRKNVVWSSAFNVNCRFLVEKQVKKEH